MNTVRVAMDALPWVGREGRSDRAVLDALVAMGADTRNVEATSGDIATRSGLSLRTVKTVVSRLADAGWVTRHLRSTRLPDGRTRQLPSRYRVHAPQPPDTRTGRQAAQALTTAASRHSWGKQWRALLVLHEVARRAIGDDCAAPSASVIDLAVACGLTPNEVISGLDTLAARGLLTRGRGACRVIAVRDVDESLDLSLPRPLAAHDVFNHWAGFPTSYGVVLAAVEHHPATVAELSTATGLGESAIRAALSCWVDGGWVVKVGKDYRIAGGMDLWAALDEWAAEEPSLAIAGVSKRLALWYRAEQRRADRAGRIEVDDRFTYDTYDSGVLF